MANRTSYLNATELKDGRILLYNRPNSKKPLWHMRIYVKGMEDINGERVKYYTRSTGEIDLDEAKRIALDTYDSLRDKVRNEEPVFDSTFSVAYQRWWNTVKKPSLEEKQRLKNKQRFENPKANDKVSWYGKHFDRYWTEYFGSMPLNTITHEVSQDYWRWRLSYWERATDEERKAFPNHAKTPARKSMLMERGALREFFGWAKDTANIIRLVPNFNHSLLEPQEEERGESFDKDEWLKLDRYMRERWVLGKGVDDNKKGSRVHALHIWQRQMCRRYIQWLTATGMRPGEPLTLKHKHIKIKQIDGTDTLEIMLPYGKTGARPVISQPVCVQYYKAITELTGRTAPEDFLFSDKDGKPSKGYYRTISALLTQIGLRKHPISGKNRTAYSFRHYYAEQRLEEAGMNLATTADLRANMGTGLIQLDKHYLRKKVYNPQNLTSYKDNKNK